MSSSYRSNRFGLSHWDTYAVHRGSCPEVYYCNMVEWFWWDSSLISTTNWFPSHLACTNRACNEWHVKPLHYYYHYCCNGAGVHVEALRLQVVCLLSSQTFVSMISYKPLRRISPNLQLWVVFHTFLLRAASFGNHRFLGSDARRISKFFAIGMTSVTQCN